MGRYVVVVKEKMLWKVNERVATSSHGKGKRWECWDVDRI